MTTISTEQYSLTPQDARALAHADAVCFDHNGDAGTGQIRAIRRAENSSSGFEDTHIIPAVMSSINDYEPTSNEGVRYTAFAMIQSAKYDEVWRTLQRHLRAGSKFTLRWVRDNNSPVTREAGIVVDYLQLRVQGKSAKVADTFNVATYVGYDNSARMVKRA